MASVTLDGLEALQSRLASLANRTDIERKALEAAGGHLQNAITNSVPIRTGALQTSITKGEVADGKILVGPSQQGPAFRAHFVEYGTSKMSAQPFMRPTFEREKSRIESILSEEIRRGLGI